ncbi:MAG: UDP-N-acetylglucosamine 1-carboxyvinyltransferase [Fimbriimonas sp.]|nr:UDP-N-acetylglucosamine 1-carboxyvinyltransferase [Fimbriimonas sp.]
MNTYHIRGGRKLLGEVDVAGSKNAALAIMSAVVLAEGTTILHNVPNVSDTRTKAKLLEVFGAKVQWREGSLLIDCSRLHDGEANEEMVRSIRTSFYLLGPLVARIGYVTLPAPGGCKIGARPVDLHVKGLLALGADLELSEGRYTVRAKQLRGCEIYLDVPSAGATQHLMATATLAKGITVIQNAAIEPEVTALAEFLNRMGANVEGAGTSTITIQGSQRLEPCGYTIPPDRLQAGTYLLAGAITGGEVTVRGIIPDNQTAVINKLREIGAELTEGPDWLRVKAGHHHKAVRIKTMPYPGFPTDMQQPMSALLTVCEGTSVVEETIYESRIGHVQELNRMGANILQEGRTSIITGVARLRGATVTASDLRAGAALVLAALASEGESFVQNVHFIDRGYDDLEGTIRALGGDITRIDSIERRGKVGEALH